MYIRYNLYDNLYNRYGTTDITDSIRNNKISPNSERPSNIEIDSFNKYQKLIS